MTPLSTHLPVVQPGQRPGRGMTTHTSRQPSPAEAVAILDVPESDALRQALSVVPTSSGGVMLPPTPEAQADASRRLAALRVLLQPANTDSVKLWLGSLAAVSERPPEGPRLEDAVEALAGLLELPAGCYTRATVAAAALHCKYFPGLAKLDEVLRPVARKLRFQAMRMENILGLAPKGPSPRAQRAASAAGDDAGVMTAAEVQDRLSALRSGPRDRFAIIAARALLASLRRDAPSLAETHGPAVAEFIAGGTIEAPATTTPRPLAPAKHLPADTVAALRRDNPLVQRAIAAQP